jgi:hypothetical protein
VSDSEIVETIRPLVDVFRVLNIGYHIGGSVASSLCGVARSTMDVDIVADIREHHIASLVRSLENVYYISESVVREAVARLSSFNIVHLETILKVDIFLLQQDPFNLSAYERRYPEILDVDSSSEHFYVSSAEDVLIQKILWFYRGNRQSEKQWLDILGILKVQGDNLDLGYCVRWAQQLHVDDLLSLARSEAEDSE